MLAQMPVYLGIEHKSQQVLRWSHEEATTCDFEIMPFCRETPIIRKETEDDCLYQILTDSKLLNCRVELFVDKVFIHRVGHYWAISTQEKSKCHFIPHHDIDQELVVDNEEVIIPKMALILTTNDKPLVCDKFIIPRAPLIVGKPINLIYNESVIPPNDPLINLQEALNNSDHWEKLPYISSEVQTILEFLNSTPRAHTSRDIKYLETHPIAITRNILLGIAIIGIIILMIIIYRMKKKVRSSTNIMITVPTMSELVPKQSLML